MSEARKISSLALEARMKAKINVRQPLAKLTVKSKFPANLVEIIKDEVNVKDVVTDETLSEDVVLDTVLTEELKEEGLVRELIRTIQDLRKGKGLTIQDRATLIVETEKDFVDIIEKNKVTISGATLLKEIVFEMIPNEMVKIGEYSAKLDIRK